MGFFPVTPGEPVYQIGSLVFNTLTVKLENGKTFTLNALHNSTDNKYVQAVKLNGKILNRVWFTHNELLAGGTLELVMGSLPNKELGSSVDAVESLAKQYQF